MPYNEQWDEAAPPGTAAAATLDTIIQSLKKAIRERLHGLVVDWPTGATDPILLHPNVKGTRVGKQMIIPSTRFTPSGPSSVNRWPTDAVIAGVTGVYFAPLVIPPGVTITKLELSCRPQTTVPTASLANLVFATGILYSAMAGTGVVIGAASASQGIYSSPVLSLVTDTASVIAIMYTANHVDNALYGARVTYNTPSSLETI